MGRSRWECSDVRESSCEQSAIDVQVEGNLPKVRKACWKFVVEKGMRSETFKSVFPVSGT